MGPLHDLTLLQATYTTEELVPYIKWYWRLPICIHLCLSYNSY